MKAVARGETVSQVAQNELEIEIELSDLELAYVGGGIGDVVGH